MSKNNKDEEKKLKPGVVDPDLNDDDELEDGPEVKQPASGGNKPEKPPKGGKKIEVDESVLKDLLKELRETKATVEQLSSNAVAQTNQGLQVRRKTREYDYTLRKWENEVVVGFANKGTEKRPLYIYSVYNKETRLQEQFVDLVLKSGKIVEKLDYITFLRDAEKIKARMISKEEHEDVKEYGMIPKKEMTENGYGMYETMVLVPVEVVTKTYTMKLKLPEDEGGDEVTVNSQWLNL